MRISLSHVNSFLIREMLLTGAIAKVVHDGGDIVFVDLPDGQCVVIHLVERDIDLPEIKNILTRNAALKGYTLFILNAAMLLPDNGATYRPYDWMTALLELYNGLIYGYEEIHNRVYVFPVRFTPDTVANRYRITWGDMIETAYLGGATVQTASVFIQGTWLIADFEPPTDGEAREPRPAAPGTIGAYYAVLGIALGADVEEIRHAYRNLARQFHPDLNKSVEATGRMQEINAAYAYIMEQFGESPDF